jgi:hypothetical protein
MRPSDLFGLGNPTLDQRDSGSSESKLERRLAAIAYEAQELDVRPVAEIRAEWLRRAAEASRQQQVDPRLRGAVKVHALRA